MKLPLPCVPPSLHALAAIAAAGGLLQARQATPLTADAVARQIQDRDTGRDSAATMRMKLFDRHGRVRERALTLQSLRGREAPGAPATAPDGDRLLIRFTYPNDIRGTGFLVWEHPKVDDERFLYLPSLGRVRRIAGAETQESFVGSDFTYEDIGGRELEDFTYAFAGPTNAPWTAPAGGPPRAAWRLESRRKDASAEFPRVVSHRPEGQLRRRRRRGLQPPQREAEGLHGAAAAADRRHLDGHGVGDDQRARRRRAPSSSSRRRTTTSG